MQGGRWATQTQAPTLEDALPCGAVRFSMPSPLRATSGPSCAWLGVALSVQMCHLWHVGCSARQSPFCGEDGVQEDREGAGRGSSLGVGGTAPKVLGASNSPSCWREAARDPAVPRVPWALGPPSSRSQGLSSVLGVAVWGTAGRPSCAHGATLSQTRPQRAPGP